MNKLLRNFNRCASRLGAWTVGIGLTGCAFLAQPEGAPRPETVFAVTQDMALIKFNAGQPSKLLTRQALSGLAPGETLVGIDFRVSRGVLFALSSAGRLYTVDTARAVLTPVGATPAVLPLQGRQFGMDFNPTVDRIRVVSDTGLNLRLHPETGAVVDGNPALDGVQADGALHYATLDPQAGQAPALMAAAYTYNKKDDKVTTNYAIDGAAGTLVMQGSQEGVTPVVSPNTGQLRTVGSLGLGPLLGASFDISDVSNTALAVVRTASNGRSTLQLLDLNTGKATALGVVGDGRPVVGMAIEP